MNNNKLIFILNSNSLYIVKNKICKSNDCTLGALACIKKFCGDNVHFCTQEQLIMHNSV